MTEQKLKELKRTEFGNPILRQKTRPLTKAEIQSPKIQSLIKHMRQTLINFKLGIGLAAPQVNEGIALAVIAVRPTKHRPKVEKFDLVIINPVLTKTFGYRRQMWEGCLSGGRSGLFAKTPRYNKIEVKFTDETGKNRTKHFEGLKAQVLQHEIDHLNGVLFVDHVTDTSSYMTLGEYKKRIVASRK